MTPSLGLQQSLKQQLTLSPQLIQSFEILAMSTLELQQRIRTEIETNPALEIPADRVISLESIAESDRWTAADDYSDSSAYDPDRYSGNGIHESSRYDSEAAERNHQYIEGAFAHQQTLQDHLMEQLGYLHLDEQERKLGELIISNLDRYGFHQLPLDSLVPPENQAMLQSVLSLVQSLDPPGIAARDFRESLILQARHDNLDAKELHLFTELVDNHLERMRMNKTREVSKALGISEQDLDLLYRYLKTLDPHPGLQFSGDDVQYAIPDLVIRKRDGKLQVRLNSETIPILSIDPEFAALKPDPRDAGAKDASAWIGNAVKSAQLIISQVNMRSETMRKIGLELVKFQHAFFLDGPRSLKPLTYRTIAEDLSMHETTISRAVQGKFIDTDWGIIPIKQLFSSAVQTTDPAGEDLSKRAVMDMVKAIIEDNKDGKPISDQKIADMLAEQGVKIARRTVSKYRLSLNIDSSYIRNS